MNVHRGVRLRGDGLSLTADIYGPASGRPVLFLHGGGQSRRAWRGSARRLGTAGYRAITVDLRGHGDSDWAADGDYLLDAYARDVESLIDQLDGPVVLVGASRGGQSALVGGSRRPGRVALTMLADVAPAMREEGIDEIRAFFAASVKGFGSIDEAADALAHHLGHERMADASPLLSAMRRGEDGRLYWRWDPATVRPEFIHPPSEGEALKTAAARLRHPVVLVRAELSSIVTDESVALFRKLTPQLEVVVAHGVGHMFTGNQNDAFAETLLGRLSALEGA
ncbi:MAG TPA: alpha/beta hydrolase [Novosphingobium sp.]|nr:alpha/beta hydrolase [Novosphingobium sp.]